MRRIRTRNVREGAAIVEVALALPILVLVTLATIDTCAVIYLRQSAKIAAYECARVGVMNGATVQDMQVQCDSVMSNRNVHNYSMQTSVSDPSSLARGDLFTVTVSVPANANSLVTSWFYRDRVFDEPVTILAER